MAPPGRMGINTGIAFVFTGVALMLSAAGRLGARWLAQWLALSSAALGDVSPHQLPVFASAGYRVVEASGPREALAMARGFGEPIQLLLSDVVMPGSGEVALYDELAVDQPSLRVLYVSGYADETMVQRGWLSHDAPYLPKPFTAHELVQKVREVLDQPRS